VADSALELAASEAEAKASSDGAKSSADPSKGDATSSSTTQAAATAVSKKNEMYESQRVQTAYILKRKYVQFQQSARELKQHHQRLEAAIVAEHRPLSRLRQLRPHWRLTAPEHGTRAAPHPARPTEVLAADVDVHHLSTSTSASASSAAAGSQLGRLARRVPRYATVELQSNYKVELDTKEWRKNFRRDEPTEKDDSTAANVTRDDDVEMAEATQQPPDHKKEKDTDSELKDYSPSSNWTRAEPFAIADPALGKVDADFDPSKVAMLTLEFAIEKPSTGFRAKTCVQPFLSSKPENRPGADSNHDAADEAADSRVLVALQHSLFCSKMFDSIRREVASDTEEVGQVRTTASASERATIWISSQSEEQFLPTPGAMVRGDLGLGPVSVIHCHEGEVMVQLDCEYTLRIKLVEAAQDDGTKSERSDDKTSSNVNASGSHAPAQLLVLCRALMLHAQETYHQHSLRLDEARKQEEEAEQQKQAASSFALRRKVSKASSPHILQKCICLGSKMLMERRVRAVLTAVRTWLSSTLLPKRKEKPDPVPQLQIQWLSLSALDSHAQFTASLTGTSWYADVHMTGEKLSVTSFRPPRDPNHATVGNQPEYCKVDFASEQELELFLKSMISSQVGAG